MVFADCYDEVVHPFVQEAKRLGFDLAEVFVVFSQLYADDLISFSLLADAFDEFITFDSISSYYIVENMSLRFERFQI